MSKFYLLKMDFKSPWLFLLCASTFVFEIYAVPESGTCFKLNLLDGNGKLFNCILLKGNALERVFNCSCDAGGYSNAFTVRIAKIYPFVDNRRDLVKRNEFKLTINNGLVFDSETKPCFVYLHEENIAIEEPELIKFDVGGSFTCQVLDNHKEGTRNSEIMEINSKRRKRDTSNQVSSATQKTTKGPLTTPTSKLKTGTTTISTQPKTRNVFTYASTKASTILHSSAYVTSKTVSTPTRSTKPSVQPFSTTSETKMSKSNSVVKLSPSTSAIYSETTIISLHTKITTRNPTNNSAIVNTGNSKTSSSNMAVDQTTSGNYNTPKQVNVPDLTTDIPNKVSTSAENTVKLTPKASTNGRKNPTSPGIVTVAVIIPLLIVIIIVIVAYKCYRRKYPVRMVIGKNFKTFANPRYSTKTSTVSLVVSSFEEAPVSSGHDNPSLDVGYMELQPANLSTNIEDSQSFTDIDEVPVKMPRRKKRISVMSNESVDGRVMSAFIQEALDEVDSESDMVKPSYKKKISVDTGLLNNLSRVSTESGKLNENGDTTYEEMDTKKLADDNDSIDDQSDIGDAETIDEVFQENNYEVMDYEEPVKMEPNHEDSDEYDIVNVDSEDIQLENETLNVKPLDTDDKEITKEYNNEIPTPKTDSSNVQSDSVNLPGQDVKENIAVGGDTSPILQSNDINLESVVMVNSTAGMENMDEAVEYENSVRKLDPANDISEEYDATDEESSGSGGSYSFDHDVGSLKEPDSGKTSSSDSDEVSTADISGSEIHILTNKFTTEDQFAASAFTDGKEKNSGITDDNGREKFIIEQLNASSDEINGGTITTPSENVLNMENNDLTMTESQELSKSDDSFTLISSPDNTTDDQDLFQDFQGKDYLEHIEFTGTGNITSNYLDGKVTDELPTVDDNLFTIGNDFDSEEPTNDEKPTNNKKTVAYVSTGSDISTDSSDENPGAAPPLPHSMPPIPVHFENTFSAESFAIVNASKDIEESFTRPTATMDSTLLDIDSSRDTIENGTLMHVGESTSTPPLPSSPPPNFENIPSQSSTESFDILTSQTFSLASGHETTGQTNNFDTNTEFDMVLNDNDLMPVSGPFSDNHNDTTGSKNDDVKSNLNTSKDLLDEESDRISDISSITDTSDTDSSSDIETKTKPVEMFSVTSKSQSLVDSETSSKVIASPKISFDDSESSDGSSETNA